ncbi:uncharacterized protein A4U43_C02F7250 [Asparagus officinalis]|uniref:Uncharacterized protein n=1 Tax=Asparagus officinalis TaxID=4686 RepID=A0A5P1FIG8_ASPOF|nr:uncharacterized protein A4U43_C02F7250 [Asparagus officinalis]
MTYAADAMPSTLQKFFDSLSHDAPDMVNFRFLALPASPYACAARVMNFSSLISTNNSCHPSIPIGSSNAYCLAETPQPRKIYRFWPNPGCMKSARSALPTSRAATLPTDAELDPFPGRQGDTENTRRLRSVRDRVGIGLLPSPGEVGASQLHHSARSLQGNPATQYCARTLCRYSLVSNRTDTYFR